jgi:preprotein translocase subunit SecY
VEHPCQQCGAEVEDGRPFCPQCRAPQIHVQVAGPDVTAAGVNLGGGDFSREYSQGYSNRPPIAAGAMDSRAAVRAALKAGALGLILAIIPLLGTVLTGALAVFFYRRKTGSAVPAAIGARLGGAAGLVIFAINAFFVIPVIVLHAQQECVDSIVLVAQKYGINTNTPQFQASIHDIFTPTGLAGFFIFAVLMASIGGALASLILKPPRPPM